MLSRADFMKSFDVALDALRQAERVTKEQLRVLSRDLLGALIGHPEYEPTLNGDIQFVNRLLVVLTPMNRKTAILYFQEFAGFHWDKNIGEFGEFTKKIQKDKQVHHDKTLRFLEDPLNNIWTWAERNVKMEKKEFKVERITKDVAKAMEEGIDQTEIIQAVLEGGIDVAAIMAVLDELAKQEQIQN